MDQIYRLSSLRYSYLYSVIIFTAGTNEVLLFLTLETTDWERCILIATNMLEHYFFKNQLLMPHSYAVFKYLCYHSQQQYLQMKALILLILLTLQMANCTWFQQGHWTRQPYSNSSFLSTFLGVEEGYARIKGDSNSRTFSINLSQNKGSGRSIQINVNMVSEKYQTDQTFHANNLTATVIFKAKDSTAFAQQKQVENLNTLSLNLTLTHRKQLELRSSEGVFHIKLIDIQDVSPRIRYYLWMLLILVFFLWLPYLIYFIKSQELTLSTWSILPIIAGLAKIIIGIKDQAFYLSDAGYYSISLATCALFIWLCIAMAILFSTANLGNRMPPDHYLFAIITITMTLCLLLATLFADFIPLRLWHCLVVVIIYEIGTLFKKKDEHTSNKWTIIDFISALGLLYLLPCFIYPVFSYEIRYPQEEANLWWLYGVFYLLEVIVFMLKYKEWSKLKRLMKIKFQKKFSSQSYIELEEKACPLCLKEVETSEIGMSPAGEMPKVDWIQAECGHHFHKACVRQNMQEDSCLFDNTNWTQEFKKAAQQ